MTCDSLCRRCLRARRELGISGVPHYVMSQRAAPTAADVAGSKANGALPPGSKPGEAPRMLMLSGAQPTDVFLRAIRLLSKGPSAIGA